MRRNQAAIFECFDDWGAGRISRITLTSPGDSRMCGGPEAIRTPDLFRAREALSQLSYRPACLLSGKSRASTNQRNRP